MEGAKAAVGVTELPTGVRLEDGTVIRQFTFREMAGPEEDIMASNMKAGQKLNEVMAGCTQAIGGLSDRNQIRGLIRKLVTSDRWFYLVQLRILSLGHMYSFPSVCPECGENDKLHYDLKQIVVKKAPNAEDLYQETKVASGRVIRWKVADGEVDEAIERMATDKNAATVGLFARIREIDGKPVALADVLHLSIRDRSELRKAIEEHEGDFDDEFDATCKKCGHEYKSNLRLDGVSFFSL